MIEFASSERPRKDSEDYKVDDVLGAESRAPIHVMKMAGDQIYISDLYRD